MMLSYDAAGNRTSMTDGTGSTAYEYDALSRLTAETRTFHGAANTYRLDYRYNMANQLTRLTQQYSLHVDYVRDEAGQVTAVENPSYADHQPYATDIRYRTSGAMEGMTYGNGRTLSLTYDGRQRLARWEVAGLTGWEYDYDALNEKTGRVSYAKNLTDGRYDRAYEYDHVGRLTYATTGSNARAMTGRGDTPQHDGEYSHSYRYDERGNLVQREGWGGWNATSSYPFDGKNRNALLTYDKAGNVTGDGSHLTYDATGQQVSAVYGAPGGWDIEQGYDGDRQRVKKIEGGQTTLYLRSTALGGQVVGEYNQSGTWLRGYVYDGNAQLLAMQAGWVEWVHTDPVTKSKRVTDRWGNSIAAIDVDPWGGETSRMENSGVLSRKYTTYERDGNGRDQAMQRSYHGWFSRFDQPDPFDGSYDLTNPQSFNRYAYVNNDPVNFVDPSGLEEDEVVRVYTWAPAWNWRQLSGGRSGGGIRPRPLQRESPSQTAPDINDLRNRIASMVNNPKCAEFITNLINGAAALTGNPAVSTDALKLFDAIKGQEGFVYHQSPKNEIAYSTIRGSISRDDAQVLLAPPFPNHNGNRGFAESQSRIGAVSALHETIHLAGKNGSYSDETLAAVVRGMPGQLPPRGDITKVLPASNYWGGVLSAACGPKPR